MACFNHSGVFASSSSQSNFLRLCFRASWARRYGWCRVFSSCLLGHLTSYTSSVCIKYYENHRTVKWARIFASLPRPLSSTAPPTFFDEFRYRYHATPQWNMSRAGRVYERGQFLNEDLRRNINHDVV